MKSLLAAGLAAAAALAMPAPASAATVVFDFGANGGGLNTGANPDVYTLTVGGVTVTAKAYSNLSAITDWVSYDDQDDVTHTSNGLGVRGNNSGQINDNGLLSDGEGILLTFGQEVTLTQALFGDFGAMDDVMFEWGSPLNEGETLDPLAVSGGGVFNGSFTGTQFFFAANNANIFKKDSFRLAGVTVNAVPEPGTWLMLILSFGLLGDVMRRKQARRYGFA